MAQFSPSDAAVEGFRVIGAHWRTVVGWAAFNLIAFVAIVVLTVVVALSVSGAGSGDAVALAGAIGGVLDAVGTLIILATVTSGLYRLMLRPTEPGFMNLRIGLDELRVLAVWLIWIVGALLFAYVAVRLGSLASRAAGWLAAPVGLAALAIAIWLALRFSLAAPLSFAQRRLGFGRSWRATRGAAWSLLGMSLLVTCFVLLVCIAAAILFFVAAVLVLGFGDAVAAVARPQSVQEHPGIYLMQLAFDLVLSAVLIVIVHAPLVAACRALAPEVERPA